MTTFLVAFLASLVLLGMSICLIIESREVFVDNPIGGMKGSRSFTFILGIISLAMAGLVLAITAAGLVSLVDYF